MATQRATGRVLVTSGPTRAYIDRVRYIANTSSGALGARIVEALSSRGVGVKLILGSGAERPDIQEGCFLEIAPVVTIEDLIAQVRAAADGTIRAVVHAMAVLDYTPERSICEKRSSDTPFWDIRLARTPKVTALIRELMPDAYTVGFKLEAGVSEPELVRRSFESLRKHRLDLVVANDLDRVGAEAHEALFIDSGGGIIHRARTKREIAEKIADCILERSDLPRLGDR